MGRRPPKVSADIVDLSALCAEVINTQGSADFLRYGEKDVRISFTLRIDSKIKDKIWYQKLKPFTAKVVVEAISENNVIIASTISHYTINESDGTHSQYISGEIQGIKPEFGRRISRLRAGWVYGN